MSQQNPIEFIITHKETIKPVHFQCEGKIKKTWEILQKTLPEGNKIAIEKEVDELVKNWSTPKGGMVVFNYGMGEAIGVDDETTRFMFDKFNDSTNISLKL